VAASQESTPELGVQTRRGGRAVARAGAHKLLLPVSIGCVVFLVATAAFAWANHDRPVLRVQVSFDAKACCSFQIWPNGVAKGSLTLLPVTAGTGVYSAPIYTSHIDQLYLTTGSQPGGSARIERIWVQRGKTTLDEVPVDELRGATVYDATGRPFEHGVALRSTGPQPAIALPLSLDAHEGQLRLLLARLVSERLIAFGLLLVFGALALAVVAVRRQALGFLIALAAMLVLVRGAPWLSWRLDLHDDVTRAVGYASYVGLWKARERMILEVAIAVPFFVAAVVALIRRRRPIAAVIPVVESSPRPLRRGIPAMLIALPSVVIGLAAMPDLRLYIGQPGQYVPSWDANNYIFWQYLVRTTTLEPVKDFYWLYGFQWLTDERPPWGNVITYVWFLSFWVFIAIGSWSTLARFFSGRSLVWRYLLLSALWVTAVVTGDMPFTTRYVAALALLLMFTGIDRVDRWWSWRRVLFVVAFVDVALFEPAQALYATAGIVFFALVELVAEAWADRGARLRWSTTTVMTIVFPIGITTLLFAVTGTLGETIALYRALTLSSAAYAFPSQVDAWVTSPKTLESAIFWAVPATLTVGLVGLVVRRGRTRLSYGVVGALGMLGLMIMQKQILRPHIATQTWLPLVFGLAYWAVSDTLLGTTRRWSYVLGIAGVAGALVLVSGGYRTGWDAFSGGPTRLEGTIHALVRDRGTFARQAGEYFAPSRFARFTYAQPVVADLKAMPPQRRRSLWALSDDPEIPMMLGQSWHYYFNDLYDASPIDFQQKLVHELDDHPPATVVWDFSAHSMIFDAVPNPVRVPIIFSWAVRHLEPRERVGTYEILRQRQSAEPIALAWWRRRIGVREDLGHIPAVTKLPGASCAAGKPCTEYLFVRFPSGVPHPPQVVVPVTVRGLRFEVAFETGPESDYVVPLDRLWFVGGVPGARPNVDTASVGGATVEVLRRHRGNGVLY
jgi:hypothetical protein